MYLFLSYDSNKHVIQCSPYENESNTLLKKEAKQDSIYCFFLKKTDGISVLNSDCWFYYMDYNPPVINQLRMESFRFDSSAIIEWSFLSDDSYIKEYSIQKRISGNTTLEPIFATQSESCLKKEHIFDFDFLFQDDQLDPQNTYEYSITVSDILKNTKTTNPRTIKLAPIATPSNWDRFAKQNHPVYKYFTASPTVTVAVNPSIIGDGYWVNYQSGKNLDYTDPKRIYFDTAEDSYYTESGFTNATQTTFHLGTEGVFYFRIQVQDNLGTNKNLFGSPIFHLVVDTTAPNPVKNLTLSTVGDPMNNTMGYVYLNWSPVENFMYYHVYRRNFNTDTTSFEELTQKMLTDNYFIDPVTSDMQTSSFEYYIQPEDFAGNICNGESAQKKKIKIFKGPRIKWTEIQDTTYDEQKLIFIDRDNSDATNVSQFDLWIKRETNMDTVYIDTSPMIDYDLKAVSLPETGMYGIRAGYQETVNEDTFYVWSNTIYVYKDKQTGLADQKLQLTSFALYQNYPNPFNGHTLIKYSVPNNGHVKLIIFNIIGEEVVRLVDQQMQTGQYTVQWDGRNCQQQSVPSGIYIQQLITKDLSLNKKMLLIK